MARAKQNLIRVSWREIRITTFGGTSGKDFDFDILFSNAPNDNEAEAETRQVARDVIAEFVRQGKLPSKELILVRVCALQDGLKGETGSPLVRPLGCTKYSSFRDQLEFDETANRVPSWFHLQ